MGDTLMLRRPRSLIFRLTPLVGEVKSFEEKSRDLLSVAFHEIRPVLQILDVSRITGLHSLKAELRLMEEGLQLT